MTRIFFLMTRIFKVYYLFFVKVHDVILITSCFLASNVSIYDVILQYRK